MLLQVGLTSSKLKESLHQPLHRDVLRPWLDLSIELTQEMFPLSSLFCGQSIGWSGFAYFKSAIALWLQHFVAMGMLFDC